MTSYRIPTDDYWMTTPEAAARICMSLSAFYSIAPRLTQYVESKSRSANGKSCTGAGRLWQRQEIEQVRKIRCECGLKTLDAARVMDALEDCRIGAMARPGLVSIDAASSPVVSKEGR